MRRLSYLVFFQHGAILFPFKSIVSYSQRYAQSLTLNKPNSIDALKEQKQIVLTSRAVKKLHNLVASELYLGQLLRLSVDAGGCQGFQYHFYLDSPMESDILIEQDEAKVLIDKESLGLLKKCEIDYVEEILMSGFKVIKNASATSVCSCGVSFDTF